VSITSSFPKIRGGARVLWCDNGANVRRLDPVIQLYRVERWHDLLEEALVLGLKCAKAMKDEVKINSISLELCSRGTPTLNSL
jgi:Foie gras liver health family 1